MPGTILAACLALAASGLPPGREARIDALFAEFQRPGSPGCSVGVAQDGALVFARGYGLANLEWGTPIGPDTAFWVGSIAKQFTAAAVHLLALDGLLSLDDDVRRWIPELPDLGGRVLLRHLLSHTSGLRSGVFGLAFQSRASASESELLEMYGRQRGRHFPPGTAHSYSDLNYFLLGLVVKRAAGRPLRQVAAERIFAPLGMTRTLYLDDHSEPVARRATGYLPAGGRWVAGDPVLGDTVGESGLYTTVEDLVRWQLNFEQPRVGGPPFVEAMVRPGYLVERGKLTAEYGSGLNHYLLSGEKVIGHGGLGDGYRASVLRFPERRLHVVVLCNTVTPHIWKAVDGLSSLFLGKAIEDLPAAPPEPEAAQAGRAGLYRDPGSGMQVRLSAAGGKLYLGDSGSGRALVHLGDGEYMWRGNPGLVNVLADGRQLRWLPELGLPAVLERFERRRPSAAEQRRAVGHYYSPELDVLWELSLDEGLLALRIQGGPRRRLTPGVRGEWVSGNITIRLEPGRGPARGFRVYSGSVLGMPFERVRLGPSGEDAPPVAPAR